MPWVVPLTYPPRLQSKVVLYDRQGEQTNQVSISDSEQREFDNSGQAKTISHIEWDSRGEKIAIKCKNSSTISIWNTSTNEVYAVDIGVKHNASFITWHLEKPILAIGTDKGSLVLYNDDRKQKVVLVGYHSKALTCSAWNDEGYLALGSSDNQVSIMRPKAGTEEGEDTQLNKMALKGEPIAIDFAPVSKKEQASSPSVVRVSINVNRRSMMLLDIKKEEGKRTTSVPQHQEIQLEENYGRILVHSWYREQYIVAGTDTGYIVIIGTEMGQSAKHVHPFRFFRDPIADLSVSDTCSLEVPHHAQTRKEGIPDNAGEQSKSVLACCGSKNVLILDITKPSAAVEIMSHSLTSSGDQKAKGSDGSKGAGKRRGSLHRWAAGPGLDHGGKDAGVCEHLRWTSDGQILSVSSQDRSVHSLLVSLPIVGASCGGKIAYLTSLAEVSIVDIHEGESRSGTLSINSSQDADQKDSQDGTRKQHLLSCSILANIKTETEPSFCALGPAHVVVALNNECWFYSIEEEAPEMNFDYITSIESIRLNSRHAAILSEGRIHLHRIASQAGDQGVDKNEIVLPGSGASGDVTSVAMTETFLIAGTGSGSILYWLVSDPSSGATWDEGEGDDGGQGPGLQNLAPPPQINEYRHGHKGDDGLSGSGVGGGTINSAIMDDGYGSPRRAPASQHGITSIVPNASGTHLVFSDARRQVFFYNAVNDQVLPVLPPAGTNFAFQQDKGRNSNEGDTSIARQRVVPTILWDTDDPNVFVVFAERTHGESLSFGSKHQAVSDPNNSGFVAVYVYVPTSTSGSEVKLAGMHALRSLPGKPLLLSKGFLIFLTGSVNLERVLLDTHRHIMAKYSLQQVEGGKKGGGMTISTSASANKHDRLVRHEFDQHLALCHAEEAKEIALLSMDRGMWIALASQALETLDIDLAILGYRMAGDSSKASALTRLRHLEDKHLLAGHALLILGEGSAKPGDGSVVEVAESYFFRSSDPKAALEMHVDLKNWERALELAEEVSTTDLERAHINKEHAGTLELRGEYQAARRAYDIVIGLFNACLPRRPGQSFAGPGYGLEDRDLEDSIHAEFGSEYDSLGGTLRGGRDDMQAGADQAGARDPEGEAEEASPQQVLGQVKVCKGGIARCIIHLGDVEAGVQIALDLAQEEEGGAPGDASAHKRKMDMFKDFATILEEAGHLTEAAEMHHVCGNVEQAATLFVKSSQFDRAKPLMTQVMAPSLHQVFAKAMEMRGDYQLALSSYQRANDSQSLVRLYLSNNGIRNPHKAFAIVRQTRSLESAKLALQYCLDKGDHEGQTEMLVILGRVTEAMELAIVHNTVDALVSNINNSEAEPQVYLQIAKYYEQHSQYLKAGRMYETCCKSASLRPSLAENLVPSGDFYVEESTSDTVSEFIDACNNSAVHFYLKDGTSEAVDSAIALVGRVRSSSQIAQVVDWLADQTQSTSAAASKEGARHLFELHIALGDLTRAAHVACVLSRQEQDMGNYKLAHEQVHHAYCELRGELRKRKDQAEDGEDEDGEGDAREENENPNTSRGAEAKAKQGAASSKAKEDTEDLEDSVLSELMRQLIVLHSYVLVKTHVKLGDHLSAARLLVRVSKHISKFPAHIVPILTSTVIECQRAGLKWAAYEHASVLMRDPDYRSQIAQAYKRKIENVIRKPDPALKEARAKGGQGGDDQKELLSKCPNCGAIGAEYDLQCQHCKVVIPFCSASGKRMVAEDWGRCDSCKFPFLCSQMRRIAEKGESSCQLCRAKLGPDALVPKPFKKKWIYV